MTDRYWLVPPARQQATIVDCLYEPDDLRAALVALLRQSGGKATIPGYAIAEAASETRGRPRPQVRALRQGDPPHDVHLELIDATEG